LIGLADVEAFDFAVLNGLGFFQALCFAPDARPTFSCLAKRRVGKEKASPARRRRCATIPCATRLWRGLRNSSLRGSDSPRPSLTSPPPAPALLGGVQGGEGRRSVTAYALRFLLVRLEPASKRRSITEKLSGMNGR
jgi:hypothetical protein